MAPQWLDRLLCKASLLVALNLLNKLPEEIQSRVIIIKILEQIDLKEMTMEVLSILMILMKMMVC